MKIKIKVHPNSSQEKIEKISDGNFEIWFREKPINGEANVELCKILKKYFKKSVKISSGFSSRNKIIEIND